MRSPVPAFPHSVSRITLSGSSPCDRLGAGPTGAADGPLPAPARRLADVKDYSKSTAPGGRTAGYGPGTVPDEQGEVTA
jgi:hypothetical protein